MQDRPRARRRGDAHDALPRACSTVDICYGAELDNPDRTVVVISQFK